LSLLVSLFELAVIELVRTVSNDNFVNVFLQAFQT
jgi:hypothetical protein